MTAAERPVGLTHTPGLCPYCSTQMVNTGSPIWEDYCPNKPCDGEARELRHALREAHAVHLKREQLRAAAPEMLEALKSLSEASRNACDAKQHTPLIEALFEADAAIAKAEGRAILAQEGE